MSERSGTGSVGSLPEHALPVTVPACSVRVGGLVLLASFQKRPDAFRTDDLDEVREVVARRYCPHRIFQDDPAERLDARHIRVGLASSSLNYLQYGAAVSIDVGEFETFYMVEMPLAGGASIAVGSEIVTTRPGAAAILSPTLGISSRWASGCAQIMLQIDRAAMERFLAATLYRPLHRPLEFAPGFDLERGLGASFAGLVHHLGAELAGDEALSSSRLVATQFEQTLMSLLLGAQPHNYRDAIQALERPVAPRHVARAYDYMVANAHEAITIEDLAAVTGVSARALHHGFRKFRGASPMVCLKAIRLQRARADLGQALPGEEVSTIARRWGFSNLGRFARDYRATFGEKPSQTLRRRLD